MQRYSFCAFLCVHFSGCTAQAQVPGAVFSVDEDARVVRVDLPDLAPLRFGPLDHSVEMACALGHGDLYYVFLTDGDGAVHQYATDFDVFRLQRSLPVNPDTDACAIDASGHYVYLLDPATGVWRADADPESEIALEPVAMFPPWGNLPADTQSVPGELMTGAGASGAAPDLWLVPQIETAPVDVAGDAADDPAIVVDAQQPDRSLILGADKTGGLRVYDLSGRQLQYLQVGRLNNVDVAVAGLSESAQVVAAASNRTHRRIDFFDVDLQTPGVSPSESWPLELEDPYGLCMFFDGRINVIVGDTEGRVQHWAFLPGAYAESAQLVADLRFASQTEGCDVDADSGVAWIGEEDVGVWQVPLADPQARELVLPVDAETLVADVEGIAYAVDSDGRRRLVVSSQGDDTLLVYDLHTGAVDAKVRIGMNWALGIDGVSETDGLDVTTVPLPGFPGGLLVVQDGRNVAPAQRQNFKLIDLGQIDSAMP